jgi:hypothetical protein
LRTSLANCSLAASSTHSPHSIPRVRWTVFRRPLGSSASCCRQQAAPYLCDDRPHQEEVTI